MCTLTVLRRVVWVPFIGDTHLEIVPLCCLSVCLRSEFVEISFLGGYLDDENDEEPDVEERFRVQSDVLPLLSGLREQLVDHQVHQCCDYEGEESNEERGAATGEASSTDE